MSSIGFYTRAGRDLIDAIAGTSEPVRPYSAHDADAAGTRIQHTLQNATLARGARALEIIDLGLQPWEGVALGLAKEKVPPTRNRDGTMRRRSVGEYIRNRTDRAPTGETWEEWLQHSRFELNAFTMPQLIAWLDRKLVEHGDGKLVPPGDIVVDHFGEAIRPRARRRVDEAIERQLDERHAAIKARQDEATAEIRAEIDRSTAPLRERVAVISAPFEAEMAAATAELGAIDREMQTRQLIDATTPDADVLLSAIGSQLERAPEKQWSAALDEIAERIEIPAQ